jgi:hypothetical protein
MFQSFLNPSRKRPNPTQAILARSRVADEISLSHFSLIIREKIHFLRLTQR